MGNYVVINLAEAATGGRGVTGKVRDALVSQGRTEVRTKKLMRKEKIEIVQQNTIYKFDLLAGDRKFDRTKAGIWFGLGIDVLLEMRRRCLEADRVYLCAHGSASVRSFWWARG